MTSVSPAFAAVRPRVTVSGSDEPRLLEEVIADIRKANLRGANLRRANITNVDFYLVDLRDAQLDPAQREQARQTGAILEDCDA
jgi:uncharacterized protein YjbI with pentapeptide repeats